MSNSTSWHTTTTYANPPASYSNAASSSFNKRQIQGRKLFNNSSSSRPRHPILLTAAALFLFLSTINPSASASVISGTQSFASSTGIAAVKTSQSSALSYNDNDKEYNNDVIAPYSSADAAVTGSRLLQEDDHDHEEGEDHDHEEVTEAAAAAVEEDHDHEEDDHDDHATEESDEHDDHDHEDEHVHHADEEADDHDHGEHDDHGDHDEHDDHDDHDDHSGHNHAAHAHEDEFTTSTTTAANESKANNNSSSEPWGAVIGATLLVNLATFSGVLLLVLPAMYRGALKFRNRSTVSSSSSSSSPAAVLGQGKFYDIVIPGFAVGALVATAVFLVLPESLNYISGGGHAGHDDHAGEEDGHDDHSGHGHRTLEEDSHAGEGSAAAKFGCAVLGGFLLPFVFAIFFHHSSSEDELDSMKQTEGNGGSVAILNDEDDCGSCCNNDDKQPNDVDVEVGIAVTDATPRDGSNPSPKKEEEGGDASPLEDTSRSRSDAHQDTDDTATRKESTTPVVVNKRLCASILLGDGFHNFADGFFIAAAFRSCSVGVAISIMLVTLFHEIAQELADFIVLTKYAGLTVGKALAFNFLSGLTVCLGGIVFLAANPSDTATGVILAMAGGVYINIAACETAPRMEAAMKGRGDRVLMLFSIIVGTIPLGLILLDHKHCG